MAQTTSIYFIYSNTDYLYALLGMDLLGYYGEDIMSLESMASHIEVINHELGEVVVRLTALETNMDWLMRFFWLIMAGIVAQLIAQYFTHKKLKNEK